MGLAEAFLLSGLAGMLVDFDHLVTPLRDGVPLKEVWAYMKANGTRDYHVLFLMITFFVFLYCWAFVG